MAELPNQTPPQGADLQQALLEQQRIARQLVQKDLQLSDSNEKLNRQVEQLKTLQRIGDEIATVFDRNIILEIYARALVEQLHFFSVLVLLGEPPFKVGTKYSYHQMPITDVLQAAIPRTVYAAKAPLIVRQVAKAPLPQYEFGEMLKVTSYIIFPLAIRQHIYGLFICGLNDPYRSLSDQDIDSIAIVLEGLEIEERQRQIDSLKSEFVSIASHQLRTPLSIIKWIIKMCLDGDFGQADDQTKEYLKKAYQTNERMIALVNDLLNVSSLQEGKIEYKMEMLNLNELLQDVLDHYTILLEGKKINLVTNVSKGTLPVYGDRKKLSLAFSNLIDNAIKFTPRSGTVTVHSSVTPSGVKVDVGDTGIGLSPQDQTQLFSKFFRSEEAKRMQTEGSGLGLFIVKMVIERHNGTITVDSKLSQGTTFTCYLPK